jgi:aspartate/glutamate racemase
MKTAGLIGGIEPDSTVEYYRSIIRAYAVLWHPFARKSRVR